MSDRLEDAEGTLRLVRMYALRAKRELLERPGSPSDPDAAGGRLEAIVELVDEHERLAAEGFAAAVRHEPEPPAPARLRAVRSESEDPPTSPRSEGDPT